MNILSTVPDRQFNILRTVSEMLHDRGYTIVEPNKSIIEGYLNRRDIAGAAQWYDQMTESLLQAERVYVPPVSNPNNSTNSPPLETLQVITSQSDKLTVKTLTIYENHDKHNKNKIMIIVKQLTSPCQRELMLPKYRHLEIFTEMEVYWNITKHKTLYFPHRKLSPREKESILKEYRCTPEKMQILPKMDPVAKYFGFEVGDIIEIKQSFGNYTQEKKNYRCVS